MSFKTHGCEEKSFPNDNSENSANAEFNFDFSDLHIDPIAMDFDGSQSNYLESHEHIKDGVMSEGNSSELDEGYSHFEAGLLIGNCQAPEISVSSVSKSPVIQTNFQDSAMSRPSAGPYDKASHSMPDTISPRNNPAASDQKSLTSMLMKRGLELKPVYMTANSNAKVNTSPSYVSSYIKKIEVKTQCASPQVNVIKDSVNLCRTSNQSSSLSKAAVSVKGPTPTFSGVLKNNPPATQPARNSGQCVQQMRKPVGKKPLIFSDSVKISKAAIRKPIPANSVRKSAVFSDHDDRSFGLKTSSAPVQTSQNMPKIVRNASYRQPQGVGDKCISNMYRFPKAAASQPINQPFSDVSEYFNDKYFDDCIEDEDKEEGLLAKENMYKSELGEAKFMNELYDEECDDEIHIHDDHCRILERKNDIAEMTEEEMTSALLNLDDISDEEDGEIDKFRYSSSHENFFKVGHFVSGAKSASASKPPQMPSKMPCHSEKQKSSPNFPSVDRNMLSSKPSPGFRNQEKPFESPKRQELCASQNQMQVGPRKPFNNSPEDVWSKKCNVSKLDNISDNQRTMLKSITKRNVVMVTNMAKNANSDISPRKLQPEESNVPLKSQMARECNFGSEIPANRLDNEPNLYNSDTDYEFDDYDSDEYDLMMEQLAKRQENNLDSMSDSEHLQKTFAQNVSLPKLNSNKAVPSATAMSRNNLKSGPSLGIVSNDLKCTAKNPPTASPKKIHQEQVTSKSAKQITLEAAFNEQNQKIYGDVKKSAIDKAGLPEIPKILSTEIVKNDKSCKPSVVKKAPSVASKMDDKLKSNKETDSMKNNAVSLPITNMCKLLSNNKNLTISIVQPVAATGGGPHKNNFSLQKNPIKKCVKCIFCERLSANLDACDKCGKVLPKLTVSSSGKNLVQMTSKQFYGAKVKNITKQHIGNSSSDDAKFSENAPGRKLPTAKRGKAKSHEPVCLTLSSDEEEEEESEGNLPSSTTPGPPDNSNEWPSDDDNISENSSPIKEKSECSSGRNSPQREPVQFYCRSIRIGSFRIVQKHLVTIHNYCISFKFTKCNDTEEAIVNIQKHDIAQIRGHFGSNLQVLYLVGTESFGANLRAQLNMSSPDGPYYDPESDADTQKWVCLIPEECHRVDIQDAINVYFHDIFDVLDKNVANHMLIKSTPTPIVSNDGHNAAMVITSTQPPPKPAAGNPATGYETRASVVSCVEIPIKPKQPVFHMATYPPQPSAGRIAITTEDYDCLHPGEFLNDVIIDFYLKYVFLENLSEEDRERTHIFSSFFYGRLTTRPQTRNSIEDDSFLKPPQKRHSRVKTWTRHTDIFSKDFIIIPINEKSHWFLAIICFPGLVETSKRPLPKEGEAARDECPSKQRKLAEDDSSNEKPEVPCEDGSDGEESMDHEQSPNVCDKTTSSTGNEHTPPSEADHGNFNEESNSSIPPDEASQEEPPLGNDGSNDKKHGQRKSCLDSCFPNKVPCILIFDSLNMPRGHTAIFNILREYLTEEWAIKKQSMKSFNKENMKGSNLKVPQQDNYSDCGVFVLQYVESFFQTPIVNFTLPLIGLDNWFSEELAKTKRQDIQNLIKQLAAEQGTKYELREYVAPPPQPEQEAQTSEGTCNNSKNLNDDAGTSSLNRESQQEICSNLKNEDESGHS